LIVVSVAFGLAAPSADASLSVPTGGPPVTFASLAAFEAAAGGADNGTAVGEQGGGFRHATWDDIKLDGSEPGSTVIKPGHVLAPASNRLQPWGFVLGQGIAVANDGFQSVNLGAQNTHFSAPNVWATFNSPMAAFEVVAPATQVSTPVPAQTRGLGVTFLNVPSPSQTTIQYYNGDIPLLSQPLSAPTGATSFVGLLFPEPVVTRVVITLGNGEMFDLTGGTPSPGTDLVTGDDVVLSEPAAARPAVPATAGVPVTAVLDTFTESTPGSELRATIDWGDGTQTAGTITGGAGGAFVVTGNHAYAQTGSDTAKVTVEDFQGPQQTSQTDIQVGPRATSTGVTCTPSPVAVTASTNCTATVSDATGGSPSSPSGMVFFSSTTPGGVFPQNAGCLLGPTAITGVSLCTVPFSPEELPPFHAHVSAAYGGDAAHAGSGSLATVGVRAQRCSLRALTRRLRQAGVGVLVSCDARSGVQISVRALAARRGALRPFQLQFGSLRATVTAGRPTVLVIKPARGVLKTLHTALQRGQRVSLRLTLTASSHATHRTTTTRVPALRIA
jgi:hypothetical protein